MGKMNLLVYLNAYEDSNDTNDASLNNFKWSRNEQSLDASQTNSKSLILPSAQSKTLFSGSVAISSDITTTWDLSLKPSSSTIYVLSHSGGTAPLFRTPRTSGADATTEIIVTKNSRLIEFTSTGGTLFDLITNGVLVGDEVRIGNQFNTLNQGKFKVLSLTATSFTVENELGVAEGPIVLGALYNNQINIYSADGVQVGDKINIVSGFSSVTFGTYEISDASYDYLEFSSTDSLPIESTVSNNPSAFSIYRDAKIFLYIECDEKISIKLNGNSITNYIEPLQAGISKKPGIFMSSASITSAEIKNESQETATIFYVTVE